MREALIKIFHDDAGFKQGQLTINQCRYSAVRVEVNKILRQVIHLNLLDLDTDTFLRQYDTYLMAKNVGRAGKQRHYRTFVGSDSHENLQVYLEYYSELSPACSFCPVVS
ncbi:hypothetical protein SRABI106_03917 [Rahnella aquatilis]|nr:hypothetical protein SRABI106_03917 [Rahnella aquatilis]